MAKISDEPFGDFKPKSATGPAGASRFELPSFTKGISPQLLIDNAKSQGIITAKQQADFKNRVGKDRTALAEFNEIVKKSKNPNLQYRGITPDQLEMIKEKKLFPMTAANKPERINLINEHRSKKDFDAPKMMKRLWDHVMGPSFQLPVRNLYQTMIRLHDIIGKEKKFYENNMANKERAILDMEEDFRDMINSFTLKVGPECLIQIEEKNNV